MFSCAIKRRRIPFFCAVTHRQGIRGEPEGGYLRLRSQVRCAFELCLLSVRGWEAKVISHINCTQRKLSLLWNTLVSPGGKLTLARRNANLQTTRAARRTLNCRSCWHSVCNHLLLHDMFSFMSELTHKCTFRFIPTSSSSSLCNGLQAFDLYQYGCVSSLRETRWKVKGSGIKKERVCEWQQGKEAGQGLSWPSLF